MLTKINHIGIAVKSLEENIPFYNTTWFWKLIIPVLMALFGGIGATMGPSLITKAPITPVTIEIVNHKLDSLGGYIFQTNNTIIKIKATQDSIQMVRIIREQVLQNQSNPSFNERMVKIIDSSRTMMIKAR